ncbi:hypothetical protein SADUNF_Sadunf06G0007400 [Salix dunnii]|uniref:Uncharacterized protein n=1 Tax=Salix dunnii TaxID=1413687 RepID=A0A835JXM7_9ROSI|nr:hypothetical protein SADUNF_Sadunf06G0007400 [Salix dunnii]
MKRAGGNTRTDWSFWSEEMEEKKGFAFPAVLMMLLMFSLMISPALASCSSGGSGAKGSGGTKPSDGSGCKDCVLDQMKYGCPTCVPILHCMARCLWGGSPRSKCITRCDCDGGKPTLSECKKCMSRCKCSCVTMA